MSEETRVCEHPDFSGPLEEREGVLGAMCLSCTEFVPGGGKLEDWITLFVALDKERAALKLLYNRHKAATEALAARLKLEGHFQDEEGTVYQITEPEGRFIYYDKIEVKRTRRQGEKAGSLSLAAARKLGYKVEGE
jgi:hypothetical protein